MRVVSFFVELFFDRESAASNEAVIRALALPKRIRGETMIDLKHYGYLETETGLPLDSIPGRVIEQRRNIYTVVTEQGEFTATLKGSFLHRAQSRVEIPCVGDFVRLEANPSGLSQINRLLPRHSIFTRADLSGHAAAYAKTVLEQLVAANFDYVFILSSLNDDFNVNRIRRYLLQAQQSGGQPVIILTKADLTDDIDSPLQAIRDIADDVPVHAVSASTAFGLDELNIYLKPGKTIVFLGMSGVGKSSLLNALMEKEVMLVKAIREDDSRGRHTTTHRQLFMLSSGAMVIDTPGMRELGFYVTEDDIRSAFAEIETIIKHCHFRNCQHRSEPGCSVRAAIAEGQLSQAYWEQYLAYSRESRSVTARSAHRQDKRQIAIYKKGRSEHDETY